ncbi:MAG: Na/Pi cotransporter family protein [Myxococcales bacterium]|nr:Na/Pi cotransporter family protein [Myxococcales bacterium]
MADRRRRARLRTGLGWVLTLAIAAYSIVDWGDTDRDPIAATAGDGDGDAELRIRMLSDAEVSPGDAVVVRFDNADDDLPIAARIAGAAAEILDRRAHSLVVRVPEDTATGRAALRLVQGSRRSKAWDLLVRPPRHGKLLAKVIGGLALFFYGFGVLAAGFRGLAGRRLRAQLGRLTGAPTRAVGLGVAVGAATQLTTTATAVTVGLIEARLLALGPALAILVGAQLGASLVGALLPLGFARESLEVVAIGVVWTFAANTRRARAIGLAILGVGLVLYGLRLLQSGIDPLLADPKLLAYVGYLRADGVGPLLLAAAVGVLGGLVLQGPGPVYGLGLGLAQVSGALSLTNLLAILAGTNLGAAIGMAIIVGSSGPGGRALVRPQLAFGALATIVGLALVPAMVALTDLVVPGDPARLDYRHTVMMPALSAHLAVAFLLSQLIITAAFTMLAVPRVVRAVGQRRARVAPSTSSAQPELANTFERHRATLDACLAASTSGERGHADLEVGLAEARAGVEEHFTALAAVESTPAVDRLRRAVVSTLQLQRAIEHLVHVTELGVERGVALTPDDHARLAALHRLATASLTALAAAADGQPLDIEAARGREIEMNLLEAESRTTPELPAARRRNESTTVRLGLAELIDSYEHVGNHLFRVAKALAEEDDDDD